MVALIEAIATTTFSEKDAYMSIVFLQSKDIEPSNSFIRLRNLIATKGLLSTVTPYMFNSADIPAAITDDEIRSINLYGRNKIRPDIQVPHIEICKLLKVKGLSPQKKSVYEIIDLRSANVIKLNLLLETSNKIILI